MTDTCQSIKLSAVPADSFTLVEGKSLEAIKGWFADSPEKVETLRAFHAEYNGLLIVIVISMGPLFYTVAFDLSEEGVNSRPIEATWPELMDWHRIQMDRLELWPFVEDLLPRDRSE